MTTLTLNGKTVEVDADPSTPLLWALRDNLGMTGTKFGCGMASCGACTVHINGQATRSCVMPISATAGSKISTIESMGDDKVGKAVLAAWLKHDVAQCGYCQSGQMMSAVGLLRSKKKPTDAEIDNALTGLKCRCGTHMNIVRAVKRASEMMGQRQARRFFHAEHAHGEYARRGPA